jgi:hypothetical protein
MTTVHPHLIRQARETAYSTWTVDPCEDCGVPAVERWCECCRTRVSYVARDDGGNREEVEYVHSLADAVEQMRDGGTKVAAIVGGPVTITEYTHTRGDDGVWREEKTGSASFEVEVECD